MSQSTPTPWEVVQHGVDPCAIEILGAPNETGIKVHVASFKDSSADNPLADAQAIVDAVNTAAEKPKSKKKS